jgi:hypothetical protein
MHASPRSAASSVQISVILIVFLSRVPSPPFVSSQKWYYRAGDDYNSTVMNAIQCNAQVGDCVKFTRQSSHDDGMGEITHSSSTRVKVKLFQAMSSAI